MKNITRKAYTEEISLTLNIMIFIIILPVFIINIKLQNYFWIGLYLGYYLYGWFPIIVNDCLDLMIRYKYNKKLKEYKENIRKIEKHWQEINKKMEEMRWK